MKPATERKTLPRQTVTPRPAKKIDDHHKRICRNTNHPDDVYHVLDAIEMDRDALWFFAKLIVDRGRQLLAHLMALSPARFPHDGQDQRVASQCNFGPPLIRVNIFGHCFHLQSE